VADLEEESWDLGPLPLILGEKKIAEGQKTSRAKKGRGLD